jgi:hypothetical protein
VSLVGQVHYSFTVLTAGVVIVFPTTVKPAVPVPLVVVEMGTTVTAPVVAGLVNYILES